MGNRPPQKPIVRSVFETLPDLPIYFSPLPAEIKIVENIYCRNEKDLSILKAIDKNDKTWKPAPFVDTKRPGSLLEKLINLMITPDWKKRPSAGELLRLFPH